MSSGLTKSHPRHQSRIGLAAAVMLFAGGLSMPHQAAAAAGPFANLNGRWSGGGTIAMATGAKERIRCKATYAADGTGNNLTQSLKCASDSYKFEVQSSLTVAGSVLTGSWTETTQNVNGALSGKVDGGKINGSVSGIGFSAKIDVNTRGDTQSVSIAPDGTDVKLVAIQLRRQ